MSKQFYLFQKIRNKKNETLDFLYGIITSQGKIIVPCVYDDIDIFDDEKYAFAYKKKDFSKITATTIIDLSDGDNPIFSKPVKTPGMFDRCMEFSDNLSLVEQNKKVGYVNKVGEFVIPCTFDSIDWKDYNFYQGKAFAKIAGKYGVINKKGEFVIPCEYPDIIGNVLVVEKDGLFGFMNRDGVTVAECVYDVIKPQNNGCICVRQNGKFGVLDIDGQLVVTCKYDNINDALSQYVIPSADTKSLSKPESAPVLNIDLQKIKDESGRIGFANSNGDIVIPCKYKKVAPFDLNRRGYKMVDWGYEWGTSTPYPNGIWSYGYIQVMGENGLWGMIDQTGREIIPCRHIEFSASVYDLHFDRLGFVVAWASEDMGIVYFKDGSCLMETQKKKTAKKDDLFDGKPVMVAANSDKLKAAVAEYNITNGTELPSPYVVRIKGKMKQRAFMNDATIGVAIFDNVKVIPIFVCVECPSLTKVVISEKVTNINWCAFNGSESIREVYVPHKDLLIDKEYNNEEVRLPKDVTIIETGAKK